MTHPKGNWKVFVSNAMGNLIRVVEQAPTAGGCDHGRIAPTMRPQTRTMVYNANQQLQSATNPETGTVTYTYHTDGSVATKTDAKNQKTEYAYDGYQRIFEKINWIWVVRSHWRPVRDEMELRL